jgi:tRNA pseudouridine38-40 synthase
MSCDELLQQLRRYLPEDIGIYSCKDVSERFHARLNAKEKTYCYRIWNSADPCVFERRYVTVVPETLDVHKMQAAAENLLGEHDFSAFCANTKMKKSTVRYIRSLDIAKQGNEIRITVTGNGFLHGMVRILAGTLLEVGTGSRSPESIPQLFGAKRAESGFKAPPEGLCLMEVFY